MKNLLAISMALLFLCSACTKKPSKPTTVTAKKDPPHVTDKYVLTDQNGKNFRLKDMRGKFVFLSFVFTRCPDPKMCSLTMTLTQQLYRLWKEQHPEKPLQLLAVTLDPDFDSPEVLKKYGKARGVSFSSYRFATGKRSVLSEFASEFNVVGFPSEVGLISHNIKSILLDPKLNEIKQFKDNEWQPKDVLEAVVAFNQKSNSSQE